MRAARFRLRVRWCGLCLPCLLLTARSVGAVAADGYYDPAFGVAGANVFDVAPGTHHSFATRVHPLPDGTLLLGGTCRYTVDQYTYCLAWIEADGKDLNHNYGVGGAGRIVLSALAGFPNASLLMYDMAATADGRIVLVGSTVANDSCVIAIVRKDGSDLDRSTGGGKGWASFTFSATFGTAYAVAVQPDGKMVVAGAGYSLNNNNFDMVAARWLPDLSGLDPGFNGGGGQTVAFELGGASDDYAYALALQADGRIVLAGTAAPKGGSDQEAAFARLLASGLPDNSINSPGAGFGPLHDGRAHYDFGEALARAVLIEPSGSILFGGQAGGQALLGRLAADGSALSNGFNLGNAQIFDLSAPGPSYLSTLARQPDTRILAAGYARNAWGAVRLIADGTFDADFGVAGLSIGAFNAQEVSANDIGVAVGSGGIIIAGASKDAVTFDENFGVAKLQLDEIFPGNFE